MASEREDTASGGGSSPEERRDSAHSASVQDAQSDNTSSDDHVLDKKASPGPSKREKVKGHFGRWKWWYLLAVVILLAVLLPLL